MSDFIGRFSQWVTGLTNSLGPAIQGGIGSGRQDATLVTTFSGGNSELLIIGFLAFAFFVVGITLGRSRLVVGVLSLYVAAFSERLFPFHNEIQNSFGDLQTYWVRVGVLVIFYILVFIGLSRSAAGARFSLKEASFFSVLVISILQAGFLASLIMAMLPDSVLGTLSPFVDRKSVV